MVVRSDQAWGHQTSQPGGDHTALGEDLHKEAPPFLVGVGGEKRWEGDEKKREEGVVQLADEVRAHGVPCEEGFVPSPSQQSASPPKQGREKPQCLSPLDTGL